MPEVAIGVLVIFRELCERLRQRLGKPGMPDGECAGVLFAMAGWAFDQHAEEALAASGYSDADPRAEAVGTETASRVEDGRARRSVRWLIGSLSHPAAVRLA